MTMHEKNHNLNHPEPLSDLPEDLLELDAQLSRLASLDRASAGAGLESRLLDAVGTAMAPAPIAIERARTASRYRASWIGLAASVLVVGGITLLAVNAGGLFSGKPQPSGSNQVAMGGVTISEVAFSDDVDLLLELVDDDFGSSSDGLSYTAQVDSVSLDVMNLESRIQPAWDSLDSLIDTYAEGAI